MSMLELPDEQVIEKLPELLSSVLDIVGVFNSPERDAAMLESAGLSLERALYPLLVLIGNFGPIGVTDLAERVGRNYSTVSRQTARLEELGLVTRRKSPDDQRTREAIVTTRGRAATNAVDGARERLALELFSGWSRNDFNQLVRLLRTLADGLVDTPAPGSRLADERDAKALKASST